MTLNRSAVEQSKRARPVSVNDLHATILHQMGIDHEQLQFKFQGRDSRLTDVAGNVLTDILA